MTASPSRAESAQTAPNESFYYCTTEEPVSSGISIADFTSDPEELKALTTAKQEFEVTPFGTAYLKNRWRKGDAPMNGSVITLRCHVMGGTASQAQKIEDAARSWLTGGVEKALDFSFGAPSGSSEIRILIDGDGPNNSRVGRDALNVGESSPTMRLAQIDPWVIRHEFGHAIGLQHEHLHPDAGFTLKPDVVIAEMKDKHDWSEATTRFNIINRFNDPDARCIGDKEWNNSSVMMYNIRSSWTNEGKSYRPSQNVTKRDIDCIRGLYGVTK